MTHQEHRKVVAFDMLRECMGYVQNSSEQTVIISQDDATKTFHIACGKNTYWGDSLIEAIEKAYEQEKRNVE